MAYRVAPQDDAVFPAGCAELSIQHRYDLSVGKRAITEVPIAPRRRSTHLASPLPEQFVGGEVVFDQFKSPRARFGCYRRDCVKCLWNGWIVG